MYGDDSVFRYRLDERCPFQIEEDLETPDSKILDVGSGPYSRLGFWIGDKKADLTLADPLASVYKTIASKYNIKLPVEPVTGMVELLHLFFDKNQYDLVHMSNSLDHCFNPIWGIFELLYVTKIDGKVILRHNNNEAENGHYNGFHQWNLTVKGDSFVIWRKEEPEIVVNDIIKEFAQVEFAGESSEKTLEDLWIYNKVVIRKLKDFELNERTKSEMFTKLISTMVNCFAFK